jgi:formate/nitrite transporter FocA (FNT family)
MRRLLLFVAIFVACQFAHVIASLWMLLAALAGRRRYWQIVLGYDHLGNAVTGGKPGELISTRANRARKDGRRWGCILCRLLDKIDPGHCDRY